MDFIVTKKSKNEVQSDLLRAVDYLVGEYDRGRIHGIGITSTLPEWALFDPILNDSRFVAIQCPANLCELAFLQSDCVNKIKQHRLAVFTHRLISAIHPTQQPIRLASTVRNVYASYWMNGKDGIELLSQELQSQLEKLMELEEHLVSNGTLITP